jgi:hypothetical protein
MLTYSRAISNALEAKQDCFKQIKAFSFYNSHGTFKRVVVFMDSLNAQGVQLPDMVWGSIKLGSVASNLVFFGDEASILKKISETVPKIVKKTPATVIAKMIALRLSKLHDAIEQKNSWAVSRGQETTLDVQQSDFADGFQRFAQMAWLVKGAMEDLVKVLQRREATPEAVQKGWDLYSVKVVMTA